MAAACESSAPLVEFTRLQGSHCSTPQSTFWRLRKRWFMSRRYVSQLAHQEPIDQIFLASEKQLRPNRNGNLYLQVALSDRSGRIEARMWNASETDYRGFENGDYVRVEGSTQLFQGTIQLIATSIRRAPVCDVEMDH